jgi:hypothetical protein
MKRAATRATETDLGHTEDGTRVVGLNVPPPDLRVVQFKCVGTAPYVQNKFSGEQKSGIRKTQEAGSQAKSKRKREPKDFQRLYENAKHVSEEGWIGIPASSFRSAMISACRLVGFKMTIAKMTVFIVADGLDAEEGSPLVRIFGEPEQHEAAARNATGVVDIRVRPMWRRWHCILNVRYDAGQFSAQDVLNLLERAGAQVGIGEGRPDSKNSTGTGWGTFEVEGVSAGELPSGVTPLRGKKGRSR